MEKSWIMLNFTIPKEPSRVRVSVWRKLKKNGSVNIGQSMWILPSSEYHINFFNEIANEIKNNHGIAYIISAEFLSGISDVSIIEVFNKARDEEYTEFIEKCKDYVEEIEKETVKEKFTYVELEENEDEINKLIKWFEKISKRDFFLAPLKNEAEEIIERCKVLLEVFSSNIYEANN
ncbi:MAG: Chromate resistance protein ChrB [Eubacteriaceae bacterium]